MTLCCFSFFFSHDSIVFTIDSNSQIVSIKFFEKKNVGFLIEKKNVFLENPSGNQCPFDKTLYR